MEIFLILKKEIGDRNVVLLDLPNYLNPGDQLIWEGEEQILKHLNKKINYYMHYNISLFAFFFLVFHLIFYTYLIFFRYGR